MKGKDHKAQELNTAQAAQGKTQPEDEVKQPWEGQLEEEELEQVSGGARTQDKLWRN
jgi:hypothetical protein